MVDLKLIEDLSNAFGPSGFEEDVCRVVKKYTGDFDLVNDAMCNLYLKNRNFSGNKPVIMLDAHLDECGMMVQSILENGMISIVMLGGFHLTSLPAHSVIIRNEKGEDIKGIIGSKPVHFLTSSEKDDCSLEIEKMYVDVGASSRQEVMEDYGIRPGDPIMPDVTFSYDEKHGICFGKAFDNRLGCACIVETMKELLHDELDVDVVGAFASQEEVGMRGATVTSQQVKPDLAIVFEGSPADDYFFPEGLAQGSLKKGVQIRHMDRSYISNVEFIRLAHRIGDEKGIRYQDAVRRGGSTNAGKISLTNQAVPVLVLGVPSRYVHSHYNFCAAEDVEAAVRMASEVIRSLDENTVRTILKKDMLG
ncbi:MAG: M20/M25/M40 family metallo-hydrolase [Lachnospiraceae bacterium]|nr:M20/M25/M40 family metallo-hydrolase [Lachnospiraceae bacterium]MDY4969949.1 M20/M25/M40 family metallo-hydrolase [Lachnospiraceae bacterium]